MADISKIDKNLAIASAAPSDTEFYNVRNAPFRFYGLCETTPFTRLPELDEVNDGVKTLRFHTAGGRVRFSTDSPYIAIRVLINNPSRMPHMTLLGSVGFDMYECRGGRYRYIYSLFPPFEECEGYESLADFGVGRMRDLQINFPLYGGVTELEVGIAPGSKLLPGSDYTEKMPIVYYGSSITQGGCASRPGNSYQEMISRRLDTDYINLGFSGSAKGEEEMAKYIAGLDMRAFVYDYDHNAVDVDMLAATHKNFFEIIRRKHPDMPIIMISRPNFYSWEITDAKRRDVVYKTYSDALAAGDENVFFIDGASFFDFPGGDSCTVDGTHPNDFGFVKMADEIGTVIERIFFEKQI